jgi:serine/threonine protein kinase
VFLAKKKKSTKNNTSEETNRGVAIQSNLFEVAQQKETVLIENDTNSLNSVIQTDINTTPISTYQPGIETLKSLTPTQIPLNELEIRKEIGQGTYGRVCVGKWKKYRVALKFCQSRGKMDEFMREANLMITLPPHPNVVRMYGVSIDGTQPVIVMEYCAGGSLDELLFDERKEISNEQKIGWVYEIAQGMNHLHKHNIVHRDLAARNILLSHPNPNEAHLKISDFGMSRVLQQDIESKTFNAIGPIRWMAPESIGQQVYSKKSDVWMFGVLVYEIVAQCEPHTTMDPKQISILIRDKGLTPKIPNDCPDKLRQLMEMCWTKQPNQRPVSSFFFLTCFLIKFIIYNIAGILVLIVKSERSNYQSCLISLNVDLGSFNFKGTPRLLPPYNGLQKCCLQAFQNRTSKRAKFRKNNDRKRVVCASLTSNKQLQRLEPCCGVPPSPQTNNFNNWNRVVL